MNVLFKIEVISKLRKMFLLIKYQLALQQTNMNSNKQTKTRNWKQTQRNVLEGIFLPPDGSEVKCNGIEEITDHRIC